MSATPARALAHLAAGLYDGLPNLLDISFQLPSTGYPQSTRWLKLRLPDNAEAGIPAWAARFQINTPVVVDPHVYDRATGKPWRTHKVTGRWCGWMVELWCAADVDDEPSGGDHA